MWCWGGGNHSNRSPHTLFDVPRPPARLSTLPSKYDRISPYYCRGGPVSRVVRAGPPPCNSMGENMREIDVPLTRQAVVCTSCLINQNRCFALRHGEVASNINTMLRGSGEKVRKSGLGAPNDDFRSSSCSGSCQS